MLFRTFSLQLEDIDKFQCSSDSYPHKPQGVCKTARTKLWCIIILQSRGEGHEKAHNYGTDLGQIFRTFSLQLENNDTLKYSSDSFAHTLRNVSMSSNSREKVLNSIEIWWTQDLRLQHIQHIHCGPLSEVLKKRIQQTLSFLHMEFLNCCI